MTLLVALAGRSLQRLKVGLSELILVPAFLCSKSREEQRAVLQTSLSCLRSTVMGQLTSPARWYHLTSPTQHWYHPASATQLRPGLIVARKRCKTSASRRAWYHWPTAHRLLRHPMGRT